VFRYPEQRREQLPWRPRVVRWSVWATRIAAGICLTILVATLVVDAVNGGGFERDARWLWTIVFFIPSWFLSERANARRAAGKTANACAVGRSGERPRP
jgi:hypothetical protein